ncbi:hypothetical protein V6N13_069860 [Hibiscus sabdariffa]|uniref:Uncharacterized protein n=2 Tax=Hibiscus sabdariffa TaxID=183260 RepID=A0ABR1ZDL0_9ROSI
MPTMSDEKLNSESPSSLVEEVAEAEEDRKVYDPETKLNGVVLKVKDAADSVLFLASQDAEVVTAPDLTWWGRQVSDQIVKSLIGVILHYPPKTNELDKLHHTWSHQCNDKK